jgi:MarR family transcriptional regulator, organic hydroperoxide resistance regulator
MEQHLGDLLYQANKELIKVANHHLSEMNMGYSQLQTLMTIIRLGDGNEIDQEVLAEIMQVDKSNVSRNLSKMQKEGFIEIIPSDKDGRKKRVCLTQKGKASIKPLVEILNNINRKMIDDISEEEQKTMIKYLNRMIQNLEEIK